MMTQSEETLAHLSHLLEPENKIGILLAVQMGATPQELQLILQTADYDEDSRTVTTGDTFLVRCVGVQEHRLSVGMFNRLILTDSHPLLWNHNEPYKQVYFRGDAQGKSDALMLELNQLYGQHYGIYRSLADDINRMAPLGTILESGHGMLGVMPQPMAEKTKKLLERYGLDVQLMEADLEESPYESRLLVLDDSYFIAHMFSGDPVKPSQQNI